MTGEKKDMLQEIVKTMICIREFEKKIQDVYDKDIIQSPVHLSIGQELTSAVMAKHHREGDKIVGNYRSHGISIALADNHKPLVLELMAKEGGVSGGKAGSMHLSVPEKGLMWTSAIVGSGIPVACGVADALKRERKGHICTAMLGDGALEEGCVIESLNLASLMKLPIVFILEDNGLAIHTTKESRTSISDYNKLAETYNMKSTSCTYMNPVDVIDKISKAYEYVRKKDSPILVNVKCYRWLEHVGTKEDWDLGYRKKEDILNWIEADPISNPKKYGIERHIITTLEQKYRKYYDAMFKECEQEEDAKIARIMENI